MYLSSVHITTELYESCMINYKQNNETFYLVAEIGE